MMQSCQSLYQASTSPRSLHHLCSWYRKPDFGFHYESCSCCLLWYEGPQWPPSIKKMKENGAASLESTCASPIKKVPAGYFTEISGDMRLKVKWTPENPRNSGSKYYLLGLWCCIIYIMYLAFLVHETLQHFLWCCKLVWIPGEVTLAIRVFNVKPDVVIRDVMLIKACIHWSHVLLVVVVPAALVVAHSGFGRKGLGALWTRAEEGKKTWQELRLDKSVQCWSFIWRSR